MPSWLRAGYVEEVKANYSAAAGYRYKIKIQLNENFPLEKIL